MCTLREDGASLCRHATHYDVERRCRDLLAWCIARSSHLDGNIHEKLILAFTQIPDGRQGLLRHVQHSYAPQSGRQTADQFVVRRMLHKLLRRSHVLPHTNTQIPRHAHVCQEVVERIHGLPIFDLMRIARRDHATDSTNDDRPQYRTEEQANEENDVFTEIFGHDGSDSATELQHRHIHASHPHITMVRRVNCHALVGVSTEPHLRFPDPFLLERNHG
mmetsp:Transcript_36624/g.101140  ORF Transcript_36624/g.101140 Transcript_36624/m.101140 type:complete len:219 (-) Transcript_36624:8-664(-)